MYSWFPHCNFIESVWYSVLHECCAVQPGADSDIGSLTSLDAILPWPKNNRYSRDVREVHVHVHWTLFDHVMSCDIDFGWYFDATRGTRDEGRVNSPKLILHDIAWSNNVPVPHEYLGCNNFFLARVATRVHPVTSVDQFHCTRVCMIHDKLSRDVIPITPRQA